jgi:PiT family inorganic phosphate transporter
LPISTTHSLVGALVGAGFMAVGTQLNVAKLGTVFVMPLLLSPLLAMVTAGVFYESFKKIRNRFGWEETSCICVDEIETTSMEIGSSAAMTNASAIPILQMHAGDCPAGSPRRIFGIQLSRILDTTHFLSAGGVCFARGLNDTPKIVAALIAAKAAGLQNGLLLVALFMAAGGIVQAKKVAHTMSKKITTMNEGQGLSANLVTFFLVVFASRMGIPVSTTHVSVGSLFGIGLATGNADKRAVSGIVSAWVGTLPIAATLAAISYLILGLFY